jgi:GNAT superfamily N-acetyltransferase
MIEIRRTDYSEVQPVWSQYLWDSRYQFQPTSAMLFLGGYDASIAEKYTPCFFAASIDGKLAGVASGHATSEMHYRFRGLYVFDGFRGKNVGRHLIEAVINEGRNSGRNFLWAAPRAQNVGLFERMGFKVYSPAVTEGFTYGPNCYVGINLRD